MTNHFKRNLIRHANISERRIIIIDQTKDRLMSFELDKDEADDYFDTDESHITILQNEKGTDILWII